MVYTQILNSQADPRGELTGDGDHSAVTDADDVVPADGLSVFGVGVGHQRTDAAPCC